MPLLEVKNLKTWYPVRGSWFSKKQFVKAVDDVSFSLEKGETLGLVGESGCGKSTLGRTLVRLENPVSGKIILNNKDITSLKGRELRKARTDFQMIFQDPYGSLNPRMTIYSTLDEVLTIHTSLDHENRKKRMVELLEMVGLREEHLKRYPHQFSGGQRQRIGIARALAVDPKLIIADEPVSALDVSVQAQIINLLIEIQKKTDIALLFIAHDLAVVEHISDRIMVMYLGKIVESGPAREICSNPLHPYTKALLSAVPSIRPDKNKPRVVLKGDVPSPVNPPAGCRFHPRCPEAVEECGSISADILPAKNSPSHFTACPFYAGK
jgi:oligopeptide/dipeptide ABC transporter ATP-binding protein